MERGVILFGGLIFFIRQSHWCFIGFYFSRQAWTPGAICAHCLLSKLSIPLGFLSPVIRSVSRIFAESLVREVVGAGVGRRGGELKAAFGCLLSS